MTIDDKLVMSPYRPSDILYLRETFQVDYLSNIPGTGRIRYKADDTYRDFMFAPERYEMMRRAQLKPGWRPNENMPREAARIFLRVTDVRLERLCRITGDELKKEGLEFNPLHCKESFSNFALLWDKTIKQDERFIYGWDADPFVFRVEFERIRKDDAYKLDVHI